MFEADGCHPKMSAWVQGRSLKVLSGGWDSWDSWDGTSAPQLADCCCECVALCGIVWRLASRASGAGLLSHLVMPYAGFKSRGRPCHDVSRTNPLLIFQLIQP